VAVAPESATREMHVPVRLAGVRVLVVEDEADTRDLLAAALGHSGAEVDPAASAGEAMAALRRHRPDVLVCDIGMPGEDGYTLLEGACGPWPRKTAASYPRWPSPPTPAPTTAAGPWPPGFQVHLSKPVDPDELISAVARMAGRPRPAGRA